MGGGWKEGTGWWRGGDRNRSDEVGVDGGREDQERETQYSFEAVPGAVSCWHGGGSSMKSYLNNLRGISQSGV